MQHNAPRPEPAVAVQAGSGSGRSACQTPWTWLLAVSSGTSATSYFAGQSGSGRVALSLPHAQTATRYVMMTVDGESSIGGAW